jgi:hypothetical protein
MEYYSYVNIFEQKGVAYILLMSFLVLAVLLIRYLSGPPKNESTPAEKSRRGEATARWSASGRREHS